MVLLSVMLRRLLVVQVALLVRRILLVFFVIVLLGTHAEMALLVMSTVWGHFHAVASLLTVLRGAWLRSATGCRPSQEFTVIGGVVECVRSRLVGSLVRLLLFLLH
jgi:hypothetical protein